MVRLQYPVLWLCLCRAADSGGLPNTAGGARPEHSRPTYDADSCDQVRRTFLDLNWDRSECPDETWLAQFHETDPEKPRIFINVGANKGYNLVHWLGLWQQPLGLTPQKWVQQLRKQKMNSACGICNDCNDAITPRVQAPAADVKVRSCL